jgi:hypothetical protein
MIAPLAVSLALAFWAPYNGGQPVCPNGVQITYAQPGPGVSTGEVDQVPNPSCAMRIRADIADQTIPYQCMIVAHELGHAAMGLPDSLASGNIMYGPMAIPGSCYPRRRHRSSVTHLQNGL